MTSSASVRTRQTHSDPGWDTLTGRLLAWCVHPQAAWQQVSWSRRVLIVASYFAAAYAATLIGLQLTAR